MTDTAVPGYRSALQNPDISRAQLGALLRRRTPSLPAGERRAFWQSFTSYYAATHANMNE